MHLSFLDTHRPPSVVFFFFFNDPATTEIYTLSLHDALPISLPALILPQNSSTSASGCRSERRNELVFGNSLRSEEHTSELQSQSNLVCRLLLEKKKLTQVLYVYKFIVNLCERRTELDDHMDT